MANKKVGCAGYFFSKFLILCCSYIFKNGRYGSLSGRFTKGGFLSSSKKVLIHHWICAPPPPVRAIAWGGALTFCARLPPAHIEWWGVARKHFYVSDPLLLTLCERPPLAHMYVSDPPRSHVNDPPRSHVNGGGALTL